MYVRVLILPFCIMIPGLNDHLDQFEVMTHPQPAWSHRNYPLHTPGGKDRRWIGNVNFEEHGMHWVGGLLYVHIHKRFFPHKTYKTPPTSIVAQLVTPGMQTHELPNHNAHIDEDFDLVVGRGRGHYASFTWADFDAIAPWMNDRIVKRIDGQGLGI